MDWFTDLSFNYSACDLCGVSGAFHTSLCPECLQDLPAMTSACSRCGRPVLAPVAECGNCLTRPLLTNKTITAFHYRYPLDALIKQFKYRQRIRLATPLVNSLARRIQSLSATTLPEVMIPVPLHDRRLYQRGYNQAVIICQRLSAALPVRIDPDLIMRCRDTAPMVNLTAAQRRQNVAGVFRARRIVTYTSVAIVDDVITSGSTVNEIARVLRAGGVKHIEFWALARAD